MTLTRAAAHTTAVLATALGVTAVAASESETDPSALRWRIRWDRWRIAVP